MTAAKPKRPPRWRYLLPTEHIHRDDKFKSLMGGWVSVPVGLWGCLATDAVTSHYGPIRRSVSEYRPRA